MFVTFNCTYCGKEQNKYYSKERAKNNHFCDCLCYAKWKNDKPLKPNLVVEVNDIDGVVELVTRILFRLSG